MATDEHVIALAAFDAGAAVLDHADEMGVALSTVGVTSVGLRVFDAGQFTLGSDLITGGDDEEEEAAPAEPTAPATDAEKDEEKKKRAQQAGKPQSTAPAAGSAQTPPAAATTGAD